MMGSPKLANTVLISAIPVSTQSEGPSSAVTGGGIASVIHKQTMRTMTPNSRCASQLNPSMGTTQRLAQRIGAAIRPICRCQRASPSSALLNYRGFSGGQKDWPSMSFKALVKWRRAPFLATA